MIEDDIPSPDGDPERPLSDLEKRVFGLVQPPPVPASLAQFAHDHVARATLRFKGFRQDYERVSNAATAQWKDGQITQAEAQRVFLDDGHIVSAPLIARYLAARECRQIADWLRARPEFHFPGWLSERNRMALDGMVANGEAAMAVALILAHLGKVMTTVQNHLRAAGRKAPAGASAETVAAIASAGEIARERLGGAIGEAALELAELQPWIDRHGSREDQRAIAAWHDRLGAARARFGLA